METKGMYHYEYAYVSSHCKVLHTSGMCTLNAFVFDACVQITVKEFALLKYFSF